MKLAHSPSLQKAVGACFLTLLLIISETSWADELQDARVTAIRALKGLEEGKRSEVWDDLFSDWFKQKMTKDAFVANMTFVQMQTGGQSTERKLIQQNQSDGDPRNGYKGSVFSYLFATTFPGAKVYENISLIKENGEFKVAGIYFVPNPN